VLVHGVGTVQHLLEVVESDRKTDGETDGGPKRVSTTDPIPESKHVGLVDTEFCDGVGVGGESDKVLGDVGGLGLSAIEHRIARWRKDDSRPWRIRGTSPWRR
jgi:hypothetical protein